MAVLSLLQDKDKVTLRNGQSCMYVHEFKTSWDEVQSGLSFADNSHINIIRYNEDGIYRPDEETDKSYYDIVRIERPKMIPSVLGSYFAPSKNTTMLIYERGK